MKKIYWLIRREFWEHKVELLWAPVATALLAVVATAIWMVSVRSVNDSRIVIDGRELYLSGNLSAEEVASFSSDTLYWMAAMVFVVACLTGVVIANYCLNALYSDRKDKSILFWKSLPTTDWETVLSKALVALVLAPLLSIASIILGLGLSALVATVGLSGLPDSDQLRHAIELTFFSVTGKVLATFPIQVLWMIPSVGWFLLVSSVARSSPLLWAVAVPFAVLFTKEFLVYLFQIDPSGLYFLSTIRWLGGTFPASWYLLDSVSIDDFSGHGMEYLKQLWSIFSWLPFAIGTLFGLSMTAIAGRVLQNSADS